MSSRPANVAATVEDAYRQYFIGTPARASVAFLGVDTIEVLRFGDPVGQTYITLGMSQYAMADPGASVVDAAEAPRAELMITATARPDTVYRQLALLAAVPAVEGTVFHDGDRVQLDEPLCSGSRCVGGLLVSSGLGPIEVAGISSIEVLQVLPATADELAWSRIKGNDALRQRWQDAGTQLRDLARSPVALD